MRIFSWVSSALLLSMALSVSAADFTRTEIQQMHQAGVKIKFPSDSAKRQPYVVPADMSPRQLVQAESVDFSNLALFSVPPWLGKFSQIRHLDVSNTKITARGLESVLRGMPKLNTLNLSKNTRLFNDSVASLAGMWPQLPHLVDLDLSGLSATGSQIGNLAPLRQLQELDLSANRLGGNVSDLGLYRLPNLRKVSLANTGLSSSPLSVLPTGGLHELDLSRNRISRLPFIDMPSLAVLNISGNGNILVDEGFGGLFAMSSLKQFKVDDNIALPEKFKRLKLEAIYQAYAKRYRNHGNGTVTDRTTGLMWRQCSEGFSGSGCQQGQVRLFNWQEVLALNNSSFAGYHDWRVPTLEELLSLVFCSNGKPASEERGTTCSGKANNNGDYQSPTIYQTAFPGTRPRGHWSSSSYEPNHNFAWIVGFSSGDHVPHAKDAWSVVRLVRVGQ